MFRYIEIRRHDSSDLPNPEGHLSAILHLRLNGRVTEAAGKQCRGTKRSVHHESRDAQALIAKGTEI